MRNYVWLKNMYLFYATSFGKATDIIRRYSYLKREFCILDFNLALVPIIYIYTIIHIMFLLFIQYWIKICLWIANFSSYYLLVLWIKYFGT